MMKFLKKNKKGFSLGELIVVIAILGILAAIVVPRIGQFTEQAELSHDRTTLRTVQGAVNMYYAQEGRWPGRDAAGELWEGFTDDEDASTENYEALGQILYPFLDIRDHDMPLARSYYMDGDVSILRQFEYDLETGLVTIEPPILP